MVDNNPAIRREARLVVNNLSGQIHEFGGGGKALAAYAEHFPDCLFDGYQDEAN